MNKLKVELEGDTVILCTRYFAAPPEHVYRAHTEPELIQQWMLGPPGWRMTMCVFEAKPGGAIHYAWANEDGGGFSLTGEVLELEPPHRIVHVERMHIPDATPPNRIETRFEAEGEGTRMHVRMQLPDEQTRAAMLETGMVDGMEMTYAKLDGLPRS